MTVSAPFDTSHALSAQDLSEMARRMEGSSILKIAAEIRALKEAGEPVADLTVGDFDPREFSIPPALLDHYIDALREGENNYPPSAGVLELRLAVQRHVERTQGLKLPLESIVIVGGARPALYGAYRLLLDPGDTVLFPVPSWNNQNYRDICDVKARVICCHADNAFQPTPESIAENLEGVRMVVLNSPQNPSGGVSPAKQMEQIGRAIVEENARRRESGERPVYLLLDQIYRALVFPGWEHVSPLQLVPELEPYIVHVDGISKCCAATGLRVGWMIATPTIARKAVALGTHLGAWAPRPAQVATARFLDDVAAWQAWEQEMTRRVEDRLQRLYDCIEELRRQGHPVEAIAPQGAIYISVRFPLVGRRTPDGQVLRNNEDIRAYLLNASGFGLVPFSAFGVAEEDEDGWFRASVGAVSRQQIEEAAPRLGAALQALQA